MALNRLSRKFLFLSTLSLRRATCGCFVRCRFWVYFYPRSPCGERPRDTLHTLLGGHYFYPRSPCGERLLSDLSMEAFCHFYPRSPCGERHLGAGKSCNVCRISIHALLAESDLNRASPLTSRTNFYPRSPCGERRRGAVPVILII